MGLFTELNKIEELYGAIRATHSKNSLAFGAQIGCLEDGTVGGFRDWRNCSVSVIPPQVVLVTAHTKCPLLLAGQHL